MDFRVIMEKEYEIGGEVFFIYCEGKEGQEGGFK